MPGSSAREGMPLSPTETDVLIFLSKGMRGSEIAELIGSTRNTVSSHLARIYTKIGVSSAAEAGAWAVEHGLIGGRSRDVQHELDRLWREVTRLTAEVNRLRGIGE